ncbi:MAG TPA: hypothetical protein VEI97_16230, partial [bacterium]|nr:hypothetical protein [bacterium]
MVSKQQRVMACVTAGLVAFVLGLVAWPTGGSSPAPASGPKAPASEPKQGQPLDLPPGPTVDPEEVVEKSFK